MAKNVIGFIGHELEWRIVEGVGDEFSVRCWEDDGSPIDLAGSEVFGAILPEARSSVPVCQLAVAVEAPNWVHVLADGEALVGKKLTRAYWYLNVRRSDGRVNRWLYGPASISG